MIVKKKLKDLTSEEFIRWGKQKCHGLGSCEECLFQKVTCASNCCWVNNKDLYSNKFLDQEIEIEVDDVLTEKEKEYLSAVIKPFKNEIKYIQKKNTSRIEYLYFHLGDSRSFFLPYFIPDTMYRKMLTKKRYTVEELGL